MSALPLTSNTYSLNTANFGGRQLPSPFNTTLAQLPSTQTQQNSDPLSVFKSFLKGAYTTTIGIVPAMVQEQLNKFDKLRERGFTFEPWENAKEHFAKMPEEWRLCQEAYRQVTQSKDPLGTYVELVRNKPENKAMKAKFDQFLSNPNAIAKLLGQFSGLIVTGIVVKKAMPITQKTPQLIRIARGRKLPTALKVISKSMKNPAKTAVVAGGATQVGANVAAGTETAPSAKPAQRVPTLPPIEGFIEHSQKAKPAGETAKPVVKTAPKRTLEFKDKNPWPRFNGEAQYPSWGKLTYKITRDLERALKSSNLGEIRNTLKQYGMSDKDVATFINKAQNLGIVGAEDTAGSQAYGLMVSYDAAKHFGVPFEKMFKYGNLTHPRYVYPYAEKLAKKLFPARRVIQTKGIQKLGKATVQKPNVKP